MKNKLLLLLCLSLAVRPINSFLPAIPIVTYIVGTKITTAVAIKTAAFLALLGLVIYKSRKPKPNDPTYQEMSEYRSIDVVDTPSSGPTPPPDDEDRERGTRRDQPSSSVLTRFANFLGFNSTRRISHGQRVFQDGQREISYDHTSHNDGFWKLWDNSGQRGTWDVLLERRIGD